MKWESGNIDDLVESMGGRVERGDILEKIVFSRCCGYHEVVFTTSR